MAAADAPLSDRIACMNSPDAMTMPVPQTNNLTLTRTTTLFTRDGAADVFV